MNELTAFIEADEALKKVVDQIEDGQWDMTMPADFATTSSATNSLRDILTYHAYDEAWIPDMLAGKTMQEVGEDAYGDPYKNNLLGDDPKRRYGELSAKAVAAARALDESDLTTHQVHYSYGDFPLKEALWHAILFRALRAHYIAKVIGAEGGLSPELVQTIWDFTEPHAEEWRAIGIFGPKVDVPETANLQDKLLGLTGRQPDLQVG